MPQLSVIARLTALCALTFALSIATAGLAQSVIQVTFTTMSGYMVIVLVSINGARPAPFLLDTGTSRTMVDSKVADKLALRTIGIRVIDGRPVSL